jgi:hypothetical protein
MKDGKGGFYRLLELDKETKKVVKTFRFLKKEMEKECWSDSKNQK